MKRLFYFILLIAGFSSIHSCKDMLDENGDPLLDLNNTEGLKGPRALYREITDKDTLAEYHYSGLLATKVITDSASITDIAYSGDKVSQVVFNGFLDLDGNGKLDKDSVSYTQLFSYGPNDKLEKISENRTVFRRTPPVLPGTPPGPQTLFKKTKTLYELVYNGSTAKLDSIKMRSGTDVSGTNFVYNKYSRTGYTYLGDNVSRVVKHNGNITGNGSVFERPITRLAYDFFDYDTEISPFTLIPVAYKISRLVSTDFNERESHILSPNNPKKVSLTDLIPPIPSPITRTTNYNYDPQTYMTKGFGINYIYKPF
ncbi:hypothetical protein [Chryseobacterium vrystaatense]|uniref:Uncharacterized protein n=1 Tax=Chryseobacterium vrystaatense TaxID=307480 RepID=A0A1M4VNI5_9FLAO|nr:hypothetical protein [Chryseobacterium vrystaatense]KFF27969.1 hypothetical protein IW16_01755 [Chryseobacterium vrystaatense]SHE70594.1 hypothetical protein SAMN02787073_0943 [Chryseobacterium vrystaatense]